MKKKIGQQEKHSDCFLIMLRSFFFSRLDPFFKKKKKLNDTSGKKHLQSNTNYFAQLKATLLVEHGR